MSRAIVINKSAVQRKFNYIKKRMKEISSAGFPKEIADMSLPGVGFMDVSPILADQLLVDFPMSVDSPLPLSFTEFKPGDIGFYVPENLRLKSINKSKPGTIPVQPSKAYVRPHSDLASVANHREDVMVNTRQLQAAKNLIEREEEFTDSNDMLADSIIATMKENNLETREPETLSPSVTRITIDDLLGQRNIRIPEYVMVRRQS